MKKIICTFAIVIMTMYPLMGNAIYVNVPVYMALCGNNVTTDCIYTTIRVVDEDGNIAFTFLNYGGNNLSGSNGQIQNGTTYNTGTNAVNIGTADIDTEKTYHMEYSVGVYLQFATTGPVYTRGFGIYFTTWEWPYNDYTIGEVTFWDSNNFNYDYLYRIDNNNPGSSTVGYFCPDTDATGNLSTLKLFIDFGLGNPYYQLVYYAAGDSGF